MTDKFTASSEDIPWLIIWYAKKGIEFKVVEAKTGHSAHELSECPKMFSSSIVIKWEMGTMWHVMKVLAREKCETIERLREVITE